MADMSRALPFAVAMLIVALLAWGAGVRWDDAREAREAAKAKERADAIEDDVRGAADDELVDGILRD